MRIEATQIIPLFIDFIFKTLLNLCEFQVICCFLKCSIVTSNEALMEVSHSKKFPLFHCLSLFDYVLKVLWLRF